MVTSENVLSHKQPKDTAQHKDIIDFCPEVIRFETELGSVYEKLPDGTFQRHKYDGTEYEPMEWTVFLDKVGDKALQMVKAMLSMATLTNKKIFFMVIAFDKDDSPIKMMSHREETLNIDGDSFDLLAFEENESGEPKLIFQEPTTFTPKVGYSVFEFTQNGAEHHHGHLVTNVEKKS